MKILSSDKFFAWWELARSWFYTTFTTKQDKNEIIDAIGDISVDTSDLAKQGENSGATNTAIFDTLASSGRTTIGELLDEEHGLEQLATKTDVSGVTDILSAEIGDIDAALAYMQQAVVPVYDSIREVVVDNDTTSIELRPNVLYTFVDRTADLTITLHEGVSGMVNEYHMFIEIGNEDDILPTITWPSSIEWVGCEIDFVNFKTVEVSILNNRAIWQ